ncbi:AAA family ATPase [Lachnoclostridium sp. An118]|uniref:AAA family ATPase n=1 Tax=Lachnoclostridium sp. An118 TaxID=1965547 RepID=UPI000B374F98|nr:AAA family ATPase [Lachnoclostridium sp. An118]OUQ49488.1 hypothetical protein B5E62_10690 [Lachnoclostridium sp. An118]
MIEYIRLKNFKSFGDVEFNLLDKKGFPKKLILIYGENGIGKSNLASSFFMLSETMQTMDMRDILQKLLSQNDDQIDDEEFTQLIKARYKDMETIIHECKMVGSTDSMYLELGFRINEKSGKYIIETDDKQVIHERLEYTLIKNKGTFFDLSPEKIFISPKAFKSKNALHEIKSACEKFWGKHTVLSILMHESTDKADKYIKEQISDNFNSILKFLSRISCKIKFGSRQERGIIGLPQELLGSLEKGKVSDNEENQLDRIAEMLTQFFHLTYRDIQKAYYKKEKKNNQIHYRLMISKFIAGRTRELDFSLESTGTQSLIQQLPFMLVAVKGSVSIMDEFDTGIHDLLVKDLILSLEKNITGQLIITTHNTLLMESGLSKEYIYVINEIENGNKEVQCITHYDRKIHPNTNIRDQYIFGKYSGIPDHTSIDFKELLTLLKKNKQIF